MSACVSVAILNSAVHERVEHVLRALTVRPSNVILEVLGVGDVAPFPDWVRKVPAPADDRSTAKNAAVRAAKGDLVLLLSADTVTPPAAVEALTEVMESHPSCALVSARLVYESGRLRFSGRPFPLLSRELFLNTSLWIKWRIARRWLCRRSDKAAYEVDWAPVLCAMVRRAAALDIGPWPQDYRFQFDDAAWCHAARAQGWDVRVTAEAFAHELAPFRRYGYCTREELQAFEDSLSRIIRHVKTPRVGAFHLRARRTRLRLARLGMRLLSALTLGRHESINYKARAAGWVLDWYRAGCPRVALPPTAECEINWHGLM